jgi:hypothetical protein
VVEREAIDTDGISSSDPNANLGLLLGNDSSILPPKEILPGDSESLVNVNESSGLWQRDRNPILRFFDAEYYLSQNLDVAEAVQNGVFRNAAEHFSLYGFGEGRTPNRFFTTDYLTQNPDVAEAVNGGAFASGFAHFIKHGFGESRLPSNIFEGLDIFYLAQNSDAAAAVANGTHFNGLDYLVRVGFAEGDNPLPQFEILTETFDAEHYLAANADVAEAVENGVFRNGLEHFVHHGMYEGRNPGQTFDNAYYLANHQDVAAAVEGGAFRSGYEHYTIHGIKEGRIGGEIYAATSGDVLMGNAGANVLKGNAGKDILMAVNPDAANPGMGEVDWLTGGGNADTFVLGDAAGAYYRQPNDAAAGMKDYAMITDFQSSEDMIQLHGSAADYQLETTSQGLPAGTAIYQINGVNGEQKDPIAVVQNVSNLNLDEGYFAFV